MGYRQAGPLKDLEDLTGRAGECHGGLLWLNGPAHLRPIGLQVGRPLKDLENLMGRAGECHGGPNWAHPDQTAQPIEQPMGGLLD